MSEGKTWFQMKAVSAKKAEILIYDKIGKTWWDDSGVSAKEFNIALRALGKIEEIDLRINSPGGNVFEGNSIYNLLVSHEAAVSVYIDGWAASAASIIAMSGDKIYMPENAIMMIHNPANSVQGEAKDMRKMADTLERIKLGAVMVYSRKSGLPQNKISAMMDEETWMTAAEAVDLGFADEVIEPLDESAVASFDFASMGYLHPPGQPHLLYVPENFPIESKQPRFSKGPSLAQTPEETKMSTNPALGSPVTMTQEQLNELLTKAQAPAMAALQQERINNVRRDFAMFVDKGTMTPAQSKMFGQLAEVLMGVEGTFTFSLENDGANSQSGTAIDLLKSLGASLKSHGLLKEQVGTADNSSGDVAGAEKRPANAASFSVDMSQVPEASKKLPESFVMDKFIREVVMPNNPTLKYAEAARLAEKDPNLQKALSQLNK